MNTLSETHSRPKSGVEDGERGRDGSAIRVVIADDHALFRSGLRAILEEAADIEVVGEAASGQEAVRIAEELEPDVILMDLTMPGMSGLEATGRIAASGGRSRVLVVTMHAADDHLIAVLQAGGSGYVTKDSADGELHEAVRTVAGGQVFLYPSAARLLLESFRSPRSGAVEHDPVRLLSGREVEVLTRTVAGYTANEIGEQLGISPKTVDTYRQRVMEKLKMHHRSELVQFAVERGLLSTAV